MADNYLLVNVRRAIVWWNYRNEADKVRNAHELRELCLGRILPGGTTDSPAPDFDWTLVDAALTPEERTAVAAVDRLAGSAQDRLDQLVIDLEQMGPEEILAALAASGLNHVAVQENGEPRALLLKSQTISANVALAEKIDSDVIGVLRRLESRLVTADQSTSQLAANSPQLLPDGVVPAGPADLQVVVAGGNVKADEPAAKGPDAEYVYRLEGGVYRISAFGESGLVPATYKGFRQIHRLLACPGKPVSMLELISEGGKSEFRDGHSRQPTLDSQALAEARQELDDLQEELELAIETRNKQEQDRLQREIDKLTETWAAATGLKGKSRDLNNPQDRNRPSIHATLKRAYAVMRSARPPLSKIADHLENAIESTDGNFIYRTGGMTPVWETGLQM